MKALIALGMVAFVVVQLSLAGAEEIIDLGTGNVNEIESEPSILPDSMFWGIKDTIDRISVALAFSPERKAEKSLQIANERVFEFRRMVERGNVDAAERARQSHDDFLQKVRDSARDIRQEDRLTEIERQIEIEKEVHQQEDRVGSLRDRIRVRLEGTRLTDDQKSRINSLVEGMQQQAGSLRIEIRQNQDRIRTEIRQETGRPEAEIERQIREIEIEHGIDDIRREDRREDRRQDRGQEIEPGRGGAGETRGQEPEAGRGGVGEIRGRENEIEDIRGQEPEAERGGATEIGDDSRRNRGSGN